MKKTFGLILLTMLLLSISAGCSGGNQTEGNMDNGEGGSEDDNTSEEVELDVVYTGGDPAFRTSMDEAIQSFQEDHPDIIINAEPSGSGSYSEFLRTKEATDEFPDVFEVRDTQEYLEAERLAEVPSEVADLLANPIEQKGNAYVLPIGASTLGYIYDKAFFKENDLNQNPETYDEFLSLMEEVKALGETPLAVGGQDSWHMGFWFSQLFIHNVYQDNENWNADRNAKEVAFSDKGPSEAITKMNNVFNNYVSDSWMSTPDNQLAALLTSGQARGFYSGSWMIPQIQEADPEFEIGFMPVPDEEGHINMIDNGATTGWGLAKEIEKDQAKMEAAQTFLNYFYTEEDVYSTFLANTNFLPTTKADVTYESGEAQQQILEAYNNADFTTYTVDGFIGEGAMPSSFRDWLYKQLTEWFINDVEITDEQLKQIDEEWDRLQEDDE